MEHMASYIAQEGEFNRDTDYITTRITADGRDGYPVEPDRYRLVVARACPWANRAIIVRRLLGLEGVLSIGFCGPTHDERSWTFDLDPGGVDPVLKIPRLQDAYFKRFPDYPKGITVPAIVDVPSGAVVTNDFAQMTLDLSTEWSAYHRDGAPELYPERLRAEIDEVNKRVYTEINNGVYRCGFAGSQEAYESAYDRLFAALDWVSDRLGRQRYLVGDTITEADVRLFTTLARFDPVYHGHFKCNRSKLSEMPVLWAYARDLFQTPGFGDTVDFVQIKQHYYIVHADINPTRIVPKGPDLSGWLSPHGRESLGGKPFGEGTPRVRPSKANGYRPATGRDPPPTAERGPPPTAERGAPPPPSVAHPYRRTWSCGGKSRRFGPTSPRSAAETGQPAATKAPRARSTTTYGRYRSISALTRMIDQPWASSSARRSMSRARCAGSVQ
ncbi:glutathione S-transferase, C-terminal domain protein [Mycobacterium intracellulare 1956]|uniref:Glutathione S-transferase, C-terminal domain protein n=1 Tax=Mycobacterium intracellulare 1956 TaxID=1299331 RepID=X8CQ22_MYCIT|nr:glutathione S-transferase, C-terminal domain protein [Mycobacterium intracellulare 1956]